MSSDNNCRLLCEICCAVFTKISNLNRHTKNVHFPKRTFLCEHCSKSYITKSSLLRHITRTHSKLSNKQSLAHWHCPMCIFESEKEVMIAHYQTVHNIETATSSIIFDSFDEFQNWKQNMQDETCSKYIRYRIKKYSGKQKYYYRCHRDGFYKGKGNNIRRLKKIGSNKINGHCPAKIDVTINETTGRVLIKHLKSHVGHEMESFRLSLTKTDRHFITKKTSIKKFKQDDKESSIEVSTIEKLDDDKTKVENKVPIHICAKESLHPILAVYEQNKSELNIKESVLLREYEEKCDLNIEESSLREYEDTKIEIINIENVKNSLVDKFQIVLDSINSLEHCNIIEKHLLKLQSILETYEKFKKNCT